MLKSFYRLSRAFLMTPVIGLTWGARTLDKRYISKFSSLVNGIPGLAHHHFLCWLGFRLGKFGSSGSAGGYFRGTLLLLLRKERPVGK
jgi:hypothetical protein